MSAVDEKREIFAHAFIANMAGGMPRNKAAIAAAEAAGYRGKFIETNANRLLRHQRVKERIAELVAPAQQAREQATIVSDEGDQFVRSPICRDMLIHVDVRRRVPSHDGRELAPPWKWRSKSSPRSSWQTLVSVPSSRLIGLLPFR